MQVLLGFLRLLKTNKGGLFLLFLSTLVFIFVLFPFDDLSDLISAQVSKATNNSVYVQFDKLKMTLVPQPGAQMEKVYIETLRTPGLSADELTITPSFSGLLQQKPYGHVTVKGILKGDIDLRTTSGGKSENGVERQKLDVSAQKVSLNDIRELANLPILLKGQLDLHGTVIGDLALQEQPEIDLEMSINQFELPPANINTPMGPLTLPDLKLSSVELKGRLSAGKFIIESGQIGKPNDDLYGSIKGSFDVSIQSRMGMATPQFGGYNLELDLKTKRSFQDRAALFLTFIDSYKTPTSEGAQYKFKVSAANTMMPPNIGAAR